MKTIIFFIFSFYFFLPEGFAQKNTKMAYFSREVTIRDSISLSLINQYIEKVPEKKVVHLSITGVKDTIFYHFDAIATAEMITDYIKPFFLYQYKGYYFLISNRLGLMLQGNEQFAQYIAKKLKKYLVKGETIKNLGGGIIEVTSLNYDPPQMSATVTRNSVTVRWDGL
ncbi:hypothetical protein [Runella sp.]|uniref:hypothetical protein n=1 Tax=Runella sp. TaxID=1960881 RepID=UPI003D0E1B75